MKKIAIVNSSSFGVHFDNQFKALEDIGEVKRFRYPIDVDAKTMADNLHDMDYIIASVTPKFTSEFFALCPKLKLISRHGIGYNNIDIEAAGKHGVLVTIVDGIVEQDAVAENAIALLMSVSRRVCKSYKAAREGNWHTRAYFMGHQLRGKTTGVIGFGNIGSRVGSIMKEGFHNRLLAYDPYVSDEDLIKRGAVPVSLETLLKESDFISLNAFLDEKSYHMIGKKEFSLMKKEVILVNSARGELVDLDALLHALDEKLITGYGSDVIEKEPVGKDYPLFQYDNVIISPHTSAYTWECLKGMGDKVVDDVVRTDQGKKPHLVVNEAWLKER